MGQQDIYDFLKGNKKGWFTSKEISKELEVSIGSVTNCLRKLRLSVLLEGGKNLYNWILAFLRTNKALLIKLR